eukprot:tig00020964_g16796.t1
MASEESVRATVSDYYGKDLKTGADLKTNACVLGDAPSTETRKILSRIHEEVLSKFYGCGSPIPDNLEGRVVLDLGCGTGRDSYVCSALTGPTGRVIGVDMTDEQLEVARRHIDYHTRQFGYGAPIVDFRKGIIEDLRACGIADASVDVVISNCVINLSANKQKVFDEIFRVLKPGGELYFSDVFADRRVPEHMKQDKVLYGECLSGALYVEDFRRMMARSGFPDVRVMKSSRISIQNDEVQQKVGPIKFRSYTIRAFKIGSLEDRCEEFGQTAAYRGTLPGLPDAFVLDDHHTFPTGQALPVCGNTADMLSQTRFGPHFEVTERGPHQGLFAACGAGGAAPDDENEASVSCCAPGACC